MMTRSLVFCSALASGLGVAPAWGQRVQLLNPPGSEVGPGQVATWGIGTLQQPVDNFGFRSSFAGQSSKHIPFDWSGPGQR